MDRKKFIKHCGFACVSSSLAFLLMESCSVGKTVAGKIVDSDLMIALKSFQIEKGQLGEYRKYIIIEHPQLKYPVYVFRFSTDEYSALLMQCTHQGAELNAFGDTLQCPAHGSEFDNRGRVKNGPAGESLRSFPVTVVNDYLKISLKNA